VSRSHL